jgi:polyisoprenoid-binding protein YceI
MKMIALLAAAAAATLAIPAASAAPAAKPVLAAATTTIAVDQRHGRRAYWRKVCTTKWRNHHRVRVCRKVRGWR